MLNLLFLSPNLESELRLRGAEICVTTHGRMSSKAIPTPWEATPPWEMCADCRAKELRVRFLYISSGTETSWEDTEDFNVTRMVTR